MDNVIIQTEDFDLTSEVRRLRSLDGSSESVDAGTNVNVGAVVTFVGLVREMNYGDKVSLMSLEHYPGMTERSIEAIITNARIRWNIINAHVIHRVGDLMPADQIVYVGVSSQHRGDAFSACEFIMDYLKTQAPFWKKEKTPAGETWVDARDSDRTAAERWDG